VKTGRGARSGGFGPGAAMPLVGTGLVLVGHGVQVGKGVQVGERVAVGGAAVFVNVDVGFAVGLAVAT